MGASMQSTLPILAVLFDYGMVLSGPTRLLNAWARMRSLTGHDEPTLHRAYWEPRHDYDRGALTGREYWTQVAAAGENHTDLAFDQLIDHLIAADTDLWTQPNQPMIDWALALQTRRHPHWHPLQPRRRHDRRRPLPPPLARHGFYHRTFSYTPSAPPSPTSPSTPTPPPVSRPHPQNILFIDDREDNIAAAQSAGMQTLRYTTHNAFEQEMHSPATSTHSCTHT